MLTFQDCVLHCTDYLGVDAGAEALRVSKRAVTEAYRVFPNEHHWCLYFRAHRIRTVTPYSTGTVAFDFTGGTYERMLTLAGGTWPSWIRDGRVVLNSVYFDVEDRKSDTIITLDVAQNPGADVASTTYTAVEDMYVLPKDFVAMSEPVNVNMVSQLSYMPPEKLIELQRIIRGPALPRYFAIQGDPNYLNSLTLRLYPPPDNIYHIDFIYHRQPRAIVFDGYKTGTVTTTLGSTVVTGTGTTFTSAMEGSLIRISADKEDPTSQVELHPYDQERAVAQVNSPTSLVLDSASTASLSEVKFVISDPIDIESGAMETAFLREVERQARLMRRIKATDEEILAYRMSYEGAKEADSRYFGTRVAGQGTPRFFSQADYPSGARQI